MIFALPLAIAVTEIPRAALRYRDDLIREARFVFGMEAPVPLLAAQVHQESGYNPNAQSRFASGLAQFTPATASWISGAYPSLGPAQPLNPQWALRAMVTYDKRLRDAVKPFDTECDRYSMMLSDYNGGSTWRIRRQAKSEHPGNYEITSRINPGIAPSNQIENERYPRVIIGRWQQIYAPWGGPLICQ